jgi:L-ascorbate metabolism protein UlaG (beta-lactamase superfamily)
MLEIVWLGHGSFQFRLETGEVLVMDPWIDGNPAYPKGHKFDRVDAILVSRSRWVRSPSR